MSRHPDSSGHVVISLRYSLRGLSGLQGDLASLERALRDFAPLWRRVRPIAVRQLAFQFATEGAHGGDRWQPLSPAYAAQKARSHPGKPILVRATPCAQLP